MKLAGYGLQLTYAGRLVSALSKQKMSTFDFSQFEEISKEISEFNKKSRTTKNSTVARDLAFEKLESGTQAIFNITGLGYKQCHSKVSHPDKIGKASLDFFKQSKPSIGSKSGFEAEKIQANFYFRCSVVALAAQNKGKISVADVACLWQHFQLGYYVDPHNKSTAAIAGKLQFDLVREVIIKGEYLEIPGIAVDPNGAKYCKLANSIIAKIKSQLLNQTKSKV